MCENKLDLPADVEEEAAETVNKFLLQKLQLIFIYEKERNAFQKKTVKVNYWSLWFYYSMIKSTFLVKENCDILKIFLKLLSKNVTLVLRYSKLITVLKKLTEGYKSKKSKIFEQNEIVKVNASDDNYLFLKIVAVMALHGAWRTDKLYKLVVSNTDDRQSIMNVSLIDTKSKKDRSFCGTDKDCGVNFLKIVQKYLGLRCKKVPHSNSATVLANMGADIVTVKRIGGWKSSWVAGNYIQDSVLRKITVSNHIFRKSGHNKFSYEYSAVNPRNYQ